MENVYLVYYDNGQRWDHYQHVEKVFSSLESAQKYVDEKNTAIQTYTPSVSKEMYYAEETDMPYEQFIENEMYEWGMMRDAKYFLYMQKLDS